jgi:N,N'-diacetyllegionaminate synthase
MNPVYPDSFTNKIFLIAEIGINHNGDRNVAESMIGAAASSGADAVKFQTFNPETMYSVYAKTLLETGIEGKPDRSVIDFFAKFCLSNDDHAYLKKIASELDLVFFSAPFDTESVDSLEKIGVELYKIASSEVTHDRLLTAVSKTGKPVIMSTGISLEEEIAKAVETVQSNNNHLSLLHCVSLYPLQDKDANLLRIRSLEDKFQLPTGFSDHSKGTYLAIHAAMIGAKIIEKHFTLSPTFECPDSTVSIDPDQLKQLRCALDLITLQKGNGKISYCESEEKVAKSARKSLFATRDISAGETIKPSDIIEKRPGTGISALKWSSTVGKETSQMIKKDYMVRDEYFKK